MKPAKRIDFQSQWNGQEKKLNCKYFVCLRGLTLIRFLIFLFALVNSVPAEWAHPNPNIFVGNCIMLRKMKNIGNPPPYYSKRELFYFAAAVRLEVSARPGCLLDGVRHPCSCGISPRSGRLWCYCRKPQLCFLCLRGNGVRPCLFSAQQTGINVTPTPSQVNGYICI